MLTITLHEKACRGCEMCVDICPTAVFTFDSTRQLAEIKHPEDCIACLSCAYLCPSKALSHDHYPVVKNFYRDLEFARKMEKFL